MGHIAERIKKAISSLVSWFRFLSATSPSPDNGQTGQARLVNSLKGSQLEESAKGIQVGNGAEGKTVSKTVGREILEESGQPIHDSDPGSESGARFEKDGGEKVALVTPTHNVDDALKRNSMQKKLRMEVGESAAEKELRNDHMADATAEQEIAGSTVGAKGSSHHDETNFGAFTTCPSPDSEMSSVSDDEEDSVRLENASAEDISVDHRSAQEDRFKKGEVAPHTETHLPLDFKHKRIIANSSEEAGERTAPAAEPDVESINPVDTPSKNQHGRESSPEEHRTTSAGVGKPNSEGVNCLQAEGILKEKLEGDCSATANDSRSSSLRKPRPAEDAQEYKVTIQDVPGVYPEYACWNHIVFEQLMLSSPGSKEALLCVNPRLLARVFYEAGLGSLTPEEAEQQFTKSVSNLYQKRVLGHRARLRVLRRCSHKEPPDCVAFLAGSVLAAFRMQSDEELSGNAYYRRLADLLKCEMRGAYPNGFDPRVFESLWNYLDNWLRQTYGRRLAMPKGDVGFRRFVALPLAHVPLRSLDIGKLPAFFSWAKYEPGARIKHERILADLRQWQGKKSMLTPIGADALYDNRSSAVAAQASTELEAWDGSFCESTTRRSALVEIKFDFVQRSPVFCFLPRRPPGFPEVFEDGERVFEASAEGWYDPARLHPDDGELLESGFEWLSHQRGIDYTLRRSSVLAIPFVPSSSYSGFLSGRRLLRGVRCSVLCHKHIVPTVRDYLSEVTQDQLNPISHRQLPNGWSMFSDVTARVPVEAPAGLEVLEVDENIDLIVSGGLRFGRKWSWAAGGPPRILVSGMDVHDRIIVNGDLVEVDANSELRSDEIFADSGEYVIEAGRLRRRITIEQPQMYVQNQNNLPSSPKGTLRKRIALPRGSWTLIGNSPDQISFSQKKFFGGTIASCPFHPSWAIQVGSGPGALVAFPSYPSPPRKLSVLRLTGNPRKLVEQWSRVIYSAHIRRPKFLGLNGIVLDEDIRGVWENYVSQAKQIKRRLRNPR